MADRKNIKPTKYVTGKGELTGFISIFKPSTKFNAQGVYRAEILLPKEEGEKLVELMKNVRTEQFKAYGKGSKVTDITRCVPYTTVNEETGEETPDPQGRYILKATANAYIKDGVIGYKPQVKDAKCHEIKNASVGAGTIAKLGILIGGYTVAGKTGVTVKLGLVQIIDLVEYGGGMNFDITEEEGFEGTEENFKEPEAKAAETAPDEEDEGEEDF